MAQSKLRHAQPLLNGVPDAAFSSISPSSLKIKNFQLARLMAQSKPRHAQPPFWGRLFELCSYSCDNGFVRSLDTKQGGNINE